MTDKNTYDSIVENIKQVLETYVQPAVAGHGGVVNYLDYNDGVVTLEMSGACSGCAMSSMTLKQGIERTLTEYDTRSNNCCRSRRSKLRSRSIHVRSIWHAAIHLEDYDTDLQLPKEPKD